MLDDTVRSIVNRLPRVSNLDHPSKTKKKRKFAEALEAVNATLRIKSEKADALAIEFEADC